MSPLLLELTSDAFYGHVGFVLPPSPLRHVLQQTPQVRRIARALRIGQTTEQDVRDFVAELLREFKPDELFIHDVTLAALAVAMEHWDVQFAEEYLLDLARVERPEFRAAYRVARESLKARYKLTQSQVRTARYPSDTIAPSGVLFQQGMRILQKWRVHQIPKQAKAVRYLETSHAKA